MKQTFSVIRWVNIVHYIHVWHDVLRDGLEQYNIVLKERLFRSKIQISFVFLYLLPTYFPFILCQLSYKLTVGFYMLRNDVYTAV